MPSISTRPSLLPFFLLAVLTVPVAAAADDLTLWYRQPATEWTEALDAWCRTRLGMALIVGSETRVASIRSCCSPFSSQLSPAPARISAES